MEACKIIFNDESEIVIDYDIIKQIPELDKIVNFDHRTINLDILNSEIFNHIITLIKFNMENSAEISNSFNHNFIKNMDISQLTDFIISTNRLGLENYCKIGKQLFMDILNQDSIDDIRKGFKMT
jgi:hypothetical protein